MSSQDHKNHAASQDDFHTKLVGISGGGGGGGNLNTTSVTNGSSTQNSSTKNKDKDDHYLPEFGGSKSDPKYQTLPYNTKFTVNFVSSATSKLTPSDKRDSVPTDDSQRNNNDTNETMIKNNNNNINNMNNNNSINNPSAQQQLMTVHSIPIPALSGVSKGLATPLLNQSQSQQLPHRTDQPMAYQQQSVNKMTTSAVVAQMLGHMAPRQVCNILQSLYVTSINRCHCHQGLLP
jgi:apoptosis-stimulating of p53 protein 1